jgi:acetyl esterase/lipase
MNPQNLTTIPPSKLKEQASLVQIYRNLVYVRNREAHPRHILDLYQPAGDVRDIPIIVYIHGGAWTERSKDGSSKKFRIFVVCCMFGFSLCAIIVLE